jgi:hypothetical protein
VFQAKESKKLSAADNEIEELIKDELYLTEGTNHS